MTARPQVLARLVRLLEWIRAGRARLENHRFAEQLWWGCWAGPPVRACLPPPIAIFPKEEEARAFQRLMGEAQHRVAPCAVEIEVRWSEEPAP